MNSFVIAARPPSPQTDPYLSVSSNDGVDKLFLKKDQPFVLSIDKSTKYCAGWYDIDSHTNHVCESHATVDAKYESCFACRKKTDFNPAFYNTQDISAKQAKYNDAPHSVYVAYFGNGLAKAGIMSDSRGYERLYEQGALLYTIIANCPNATAAHNIESQLIQKGVRNSVTKKQKSDVFTKVINIEQEQQRFGELLAKMGYGTNEISSNLDVFFFGEYPGLPIEPLTESTISGYIKGVVGRYLILENNGHLYGYWLTNLYGYSVSFGNEVRLIERAPQQLSFL